MVVKAFTEFLHCNVKREMLWTFIKPKLTNGIVRSLLLVSPELLIKPGGQGGAYHATGTSTRYSEVSVSAVAAGDSDAAVTSGTSDAAGATGGSAGFASVGVAVFTFSNADN
jgi:hypothetical protein